ncbi:hypothetical protein L596_004229 [Steinernema carpocapsae]|nr:hypothetical protein L596_004229 [Steinernema carpocapsae]
MDGSVLNDSIVLANVSSNETIEPSIDLSHSTSEIVEMIYQMCFFAVGTPINAFALFRSSRTNRDGGVESRLVRLSRQLLIAHLMVLSIYCLWRTYWFFNIVWVQGDLLCKVYSVASAFPFHLWSNMVAAIAIDMLCCITSPLSSYRTSTTRVNWLIGCAWVGAILCSVPMAFFRGTMRIHDTEYEQCYPLVEKFSHEILLAFNYFHVITTFYVPLSIIIGCYSIIFLSLKRQMDQRKRLQDDLQKTSTNSTKARFLRATLAIIATFVLSWLPYQVMALLRVVCESGSSCESTVARLSWLQAILIASTCINPFLYRFGTWKVAKRYSGNGSTMDSANNNLLRFQPCSNATVLCRTTLINHGGSDQTCTTPLFSAAPMPLLQKVKRGRFFRRRSSSA